MSILRFVRRWIVLTLLSGGTVLICHATLSKGGFILAAVVIVVVYAKVTRALFAAWLYDMEEGWFYWLAGRRYPSGRW